MNRLCEVMQRSHIGDVLCATHGEGSTYEIIIVDKKHAVHRYIDNTEWQMAIINEYHNENSWHIENLRETVFEYDLRKALDE